MTLKEWGLRRRMIFSEQCVPDPDIHIKMASDVVGGYKTDSEK